MADELLDNLEFIDNTNEIYEGLKSRIHKYGNMPKILIVCCPDVYNPFYDELMEESDVNRDYGRI